MGISPTSANRRQATPFVNLSSRWTHRACDGRGSRGGSLCPCPAEPGSCRAVAVGGRRRLAGHLRPGGRARELERRRAPAAARPDCARSGRTRRDAGRPTTPHSRPRARRRPPPIAPRRRYRRRYLLCYQRLRRLTRAFRPRLRLLPIPLLRRRRPPVPSTVSEPSTATPSTQAPSSPQPAQPIGTPPPAVPSKPPRLRRQPIRRLNISRRIPAVPIPPSIILLHRYDNFPTLGQSHCSGINSPRHHRLRALHASGNCPSTWVWNWNWNCAGDSSDTSTFSPSAAPVWVWNWNWSCDASPSGAELARLHDLQHEHLHPAVQPGRRR